MLYRIYDFIFPAIKLDFIKLILKHAQYFYAWTSFFCNIFLSVQYITNTFKVLTCIKRSEDMNKSAFWYKKHVFSGMGGRGIYRTPTYPACSSTTLCRLVESLLYISLIAKLVGVLPQSPQTAAVTDDIER